MKRILLWGIVALVVGASIWGIVTLVSGSQNQGSPEASLSDSNNFKGGKNAKVVLVEFSDFQCPACAVYYPLVQEANREFGDRVKIIYKYFPLRSIHKNAELSSRAAEAAALQGKFWEMHNMLFDKQTEWAESQNARDQFISFAESLGLDKEKFIKDMDSNGVKDKVESDFQEGLKFKVNSTPSFFLQNKKIQNPRTYQELRQEILNALQANP